MPSLQDLLVGRAAANMPAPQWTPESEQTPHPVGDAILGTSNFLGGLVGLGDDSSASRAGNLVGTTLPFASALRGLPSRLINGVALERSAEAVPSMMHAAPPAHPNLSTAIEEQMTPGVMRSEPLPQAPAYTAPDYHDPILSPHAKAALERGQERIGHEGIQYFKPRHDMRYDGKDGLYANVSYQPKPGGALYEVLERAALKNGTGQALTPGEQPLLSHFSKLTPR